MKRMGLAGYFCANTGMATVAHAHTVNTAPTNLILAFTFLLPVGGRGRCARVILPRFGRRRLRRRTIGPPGAETRRRLTHPGFAGAFPRKTYKIPVFLRFTPCIRPVSP